MSNAMFIYPNRIDDAVVSGGAYVESMPLQNIQDSLYDHVARTIDCLLTSTTFTLDFQTVRDLDMLAIIAHNISFGGRIHVEASNNADLSSPLMDTWIDAWPGVTDGDWDLDSLEWESDNFWTGTAVREDTEGQTAIFHVLFSDPVGARYMRVTIDDQANDDGFLDIGRVIVGAVYCQPEINYDFGNGLSYEDPTTFDKSLSGALFFDQGEPVRVARFTLARLTETESFKFLELTRRAGISGEIFFISDPDDKIYADTRNFPCHMRALNALEQVQFGFGSMAFELEELR